MFRVLAMIMWAAPIGAFGAIAAVVGGAGWAALGALASVMLGFYITCALFVLVVLGTLLRVVTGLNILKLLRYLGPGVPADRVDVVVGVGAAAADREDGARGRLAPGRRHHRAHGLLVQPRRHRDLPDHGLAVRRRRDGQAARASASRSACCVFMIIASKGAAGVSGAGLATLAGGLASHRPDLVDGVGLIVGIDRFMSEARAVTNFAGNAVATLLIGHWVGEFDKDQADRVLAGDAAVRRDDDDRRGPRARRRGGGRDPRRGARPAGS